MNAIFDKYSKTYNERHKEVIKHSGFKPDYFHEYKVIELYEYLKKINSENKKLTILNFGCGVGGSDPFLSSHFPNSKIFACDISSESIKQAKIHNANLKNISYEIYDSEKIPFDEKFDIIFVANVFHHIPKNLQQFTMNLLKNSLKENGFLIIFEHNPVNPFTLLLFLNTDLQYDPAANLLIPNYMKKLLKNSGFNKNILRYKIFFPGCLKNLIPFEKYFYNIPLGAHYYIIAS